MKKSIVLGLGCLGVLCQACRTKPAPSNPLLGSWNIDKIQWISEDTTISRVPNQKGLFLLTPNNYSICWSPLETKRVPFQNLSDPSNEEILDGFNGIVFNTGSYSLSKSELRTTAEMAKVPGFEGGVQNYGYTHRDNHLTLILLDETYPDGEKPSWYGKWRTKFTLTRISFPRKD